MDAARQGSGEGSLAMAYPPAGQPNLRPGAIERNPLVTSVDPSLTLDELWPEWLLMTKGASGDRASGCVAAKCANGGVAAHSTR